MDDMFRIPKNDGTGAWRCSREIAIDDVAKVLQWRTEALQKQSCDILPVPLRQLLERKYFEDWVQDVANAETVRRAQLRHGGGVGKALRDLHRVYCYERFGGLEWMHLLIAFGRLDEDILLSFQEALCESHRRRKEEQRRASAPPRGKALHEAAKWQQRKLDEVSAQWQAGDRSMPYQAWRDLACQVEWLWREAFAASVPCDLGSEGEGVPADRNSISVAAACDKWMARRAAEAPAQGQC